ncbi:hypothetical protein SAMN05192529_102202 [Arachidicoccus rhizosphaerae]|uniref:Lipoprotein n=1 Tax=Arachidicoccus rhizosphaerae TaxID=551991 RepID=A0A1H3W7P1_9BACT|nr:hypothetical protein [Arachidicoccus rhizosphaerae]SDZ83096.1 hypothetical protein SAMN05192529_102202 [Arachidicoccus rhizosphaerae]
MKKLLFVAVLGLGLSFAACGGANSDAAASADSLANATTETIDSTANAAVDSVNATADSAKASVDTAAAAVKDAADAATK